MSAGIVYADVKFKKHQRTEGKDGATASTANDATYSEISIPKAGRNQPSTDTNVRQQNEELRKQKNQPSCPTNTGNKDCPKPRNCAEDWEYYEGKCYYFSPDKLTWVQSRDECITRGGHIVIIGS
ncbi:uncharacterized protein ACWYII_022747 [Salvelinus alpinus]|uniref:C-type lectin domain family 4 member G-like n=1 Tax=Salvelinus alpinus TaxID=8036 RepID=UPI0039FCF61A